MVVDIPRSKRTYSPRSHGGRVSSHRPRLLLNTVVGEYTTRARLAAGFTQQRLAELTGYSAVHVGHVESAVKPASVQYLYTVALVCGVPLPSLLPPVEELNQRWEDEKNRRKPGYEQRQQAFALVE